MTKIWMQNNSLSPTCGIPTFWDFITSLIINCWGWVKFSAFSACVSQKIPTFEPFFEAPIINMRNIFGNMVYLNVKERDRF